MEILNVNGQLTMTSIAIVEYINTERYDGAAKLAHSDFLKKVPQVLGETSAGKFSSTYHDSQNKERPCYSFPKREACLMVMSYSYDIQAKIFDRWQELEKMQTPEVFKVPQTLSEALLLGAELAKKVEEQAQQLALQAPAVAFVDKYVEAKSSKCLSDVAKILGKKPQAFIQLLAADGVLFKRGGSWLPSQSYLDDGKFTVKTGDASGHAYHQTRVEPKGIEWLARAYAQ